MSQFAIAGCQVDWKPGNNIDAMGTEVDLVMRRFPWVDMLVFGELVTFGPLVETAEELPGPSEQAYCEIAKKHGVWLLPGSMYEKDGDKVYNTMHVINPDGEVILRYRKIYPFTPYEAGVASGDECMVFDVPDVGRFGVSICYDMWFPETTRTLVWKGAEVIIHPTMTNTIDRKVELAMAQASAAQFQSYFFDVNSAGGYLGYGRSIIVDPDGEILHQAGNAKEIMTVIVDFDKVRRSRELGSRALGQPVKSFRDVKVSFPPYEQGPDKSAYLNSLGPLEMPDKLR